MLKVSRLMPARFLGNMEKPDVDSIDGLSPAHLQLTRNNKLKTLVRRSERQQRLMTIFVSFMRVWVFPIVLMVMALFSHPL